MININDNELSLTCNINNLPSDHEVEKIFVKNCVLLEDDNAQDKVEYFWHVIGSFCKLSRLFSVYINYPSAEAGFPFEHRIVATLPQLKYLNGSFIDDEHRRTCEERYVHYFAHEDAKRNHPRLDVLKNSVCLFVL